MENTIKKGKKRYHHGDLRRALIDAALELVAECGAKGFTLREAARRVGVTHTAPDRHFANKAELMAAVAEEGFRCLREAMIQEMEAAGSNSMERFMAQGVAYVCFAVDNPSYFRVMFGPEVAEKAKYPDLHAASRATFELLAKNIALNQEAGYLRKGENGSLVMSIWSSVHGLAALLVDGQVPPELLRDIRALAQGVTNEIYLGIRP